MSDLAPMNEAVVWKLIDGLKADLDLMRKERDYALRQLWRVTGRLRGSDWKPLSVRQGGPWKKSRWWLQGVRERLALRLAPWLAP